METCGSGVRINSIITMLVRLQTGVFGEMETNLPHRCGAVLGPTVLIFAVLRLATPFSAMAMSTGDTILVFVLCAMAGELFNPFFFSSFAPYSVFFFSHESRL